MKCDEVYEWLQAYLDGEVTPEQEKKLEIHIRICPKCKKRLHTLQRTISQIESLGSAAPSPDFTERLLDRLPDAVVDTAQREKLRRAAAEARERLRGRRG